MSSELEATIEEENRAKWAQKNETPESPAADDSSAVDDDSENGFENENVSLE
jgi:hypothetical protein